MISSDTEFSKLALASYDNPACVDIREFQEDIKRISRLNKYLMSDWDWTPDLCRKVLNYVIIIYNIFGDNATELLDYKIQVDNKPKLRAFQYTLGRLISEEQIDKDLMEKLQCL